MPGRTRTRGDRAVLWIEHFCVYPNGADRGQRVRLTPAARDVVRQIFDYPDPPDVTGPLAAYLALLGTCGPPDLRCDVPSNLGVDIFTTWAATGPELKSVLRRDGEYIVCPELGTRYRMAA